MAISSRVAAGAVGLSAIEPALAWLGAETIALPTVALSNHPGFAAVEGFRAPPERLVGMARACAENGFFDDLDAVLTGYLPTAEHAAAAAEILDLVPGAPRYVLDPVFGDAPKGLYVPEPAVEAVIDRLLPRASVLTPNLFELGVLAGETPGDLRGAEQAARALGRPRVLVTSAPFAGTQTGVLDVGPGAAEAVSIPWRDGAPKGPGDVFAGLIAAGAPTARAVRAVDAVIGASIGAPHLRIALAGPALRAAVLGPVAPEACDGV